MGNLPKEVRYSILERDGFQCKFCSRGGKTSDYILEVHHIVWRRWGGTDRPDNLITVCPYCHDLIHYGFYTGRPATFTELKKRQGGR
jgi:5-methylcytosine-specific restriction endonuclease McrA